MATYCTTLGEFNTESTQWSEDRGDPPKCKRGMKIKVVFTAFIPDPDNLVVLVQMVKCSKGKSLQSLNEDYAGGIIAGYEPTLTSEWWKIDAPGDKRECPAFGMRFSSSDNTAWTRWLNAKGCGSEVGDGRVGRMDGMHRIDAFLRDKPARSWKKGMAFHHQFEVAAVQVCKKANNIGNGKVLGTLTWGYTVNENGVWAEDPCVAKSRPSHQWIEAAKKWNDQPHPKRKIPEASQM
jgi:hypothetical protein